MRTYSWASAWETKEVKLEPSGVSVGSYRFVQRVVQLPQDKPDLQGEPDLQWSATIYWVEFPDSMRIFTDGVKTALACDQCDYTASWTREMVKRCDCCGQSFRDMLFRHPLAGIDFASRVDLVKAATRLGLDPLSCEVFPQEWAEVREALSRV